MAKETDPKRGNDAPREEGNGVLATVMVAIAAMGGAFGVSFAFGGSNDSYIPNFNTNTLPEEDALLQPNKAADHAYVELPEILISIGGPPTERYLKMSVFITTHKNGTKLIEAKKPLLMDAFINYLRSIDLEDFEDPRFFSIMRDQLSHRSQLVLGAQNSSGVLVTEFLLR